MIFLQKKDKGTPNCSRGLENNELLTTFFFYFYSLSVFSKLSIEGSDDFRFSINSFVL